MLSKSSGDEVVTGVNVPVVPLDLRYFHIYGDDSSTASEIQFTNTIGMASSQPILITGLDASFIFPAAMMSDNGPAPISLDTFRFSFVTDPMQSADSEAEPQLTTIVSVPEPVTMGLLAVLCAPGLVSRARRKH